MFDADDIFNAILVGAGERPGLVPTVVELRALLIACFHASLRTEERRPSRFVVAFVDPTLEQPSTSAGRWRAMHFSTPRLLSDRVLGQLAQAVEPGRGVIAVCRGLHGALEIWGLLLRGPTSWDTLDGDGLDDGTLASAQTVVAVVGAGRLVVHGTAGSVRIVGDTSESAPLRLEEVLDENAWSDLLTGAERPSPLLVARSLGLVALRLRETMHGGALFIVAREPVGVHLSFGVDEDPCGFARAACAYEDAEGDYEAERLGFATADGGPASVRGMHTAAALRGSRRSDWLAAASCVSHFASVDGAVVLGPDLRVHGFGAVVDIVDRGEALPARSVGPSGTGDVPFDVRSRGTRHRSAALFCDQNHDAGALLVSHDGDVTAMRWTDTGLVVWGALEPSAPVTQ